MSTTQLIEIKLLQKSRVLQLSFDEGQFFELPCEYLRVYSPSAEVRGHNSQERKLVLGKKNINIIGVEPVGHYAIKLIFDDGHDSGLYSWDYLFELSINQKKYWEDYLLQCKQTPTKT